jgi:uncharacterized protein (DUF2147 family)
MKFVCIMATMLIFGATLANAATPNGVWLSANGRVKVKVTNCEEAICGTIVWLKVPNDSKTRAPRADKLNPDVAKRSQPLLGLKVVHGLRAQGPNKWSGPIYNADEGRTYNVNLTLISSRKIELEGCVLGVFCKVQTWTRAE